MANRPKPPDPINEEGRGATRDPSGNNSDQVKISGRSEAPQAFVSHPDSGVNGGAWASTTRSTLHAALLRSEEQLRVSGAKKAARYVEHQIAQIQRALHQLARLGPPTQKFAAGTPQFEKALAEAREKDPERAERMIELG